jgi:hypothetical protein
MGSYQCTVSLGFRCPGLGAGLVYPVWQIYSTARISTLIAVILTLVGLNTVRYNCEVRMFHICFICGCDLICYDWKVEIVFQFVSQPSDAPNLKGNDGLALLLTIFLSLALCISSCFLRFSLDRAPHVRPVPLIQLSSLELGTHGHCQSRRLEQEEDYHSDRRWRLGN